MDLYLITTLCLLPLVIATIVVGGKVNVIFKKYSAVASAGGMTAAECARAILDDAGLTDVGIARTSGHLTDNFNPATNMLYLSESVYDSRSVSALGVAAHEAGHAIQRAEEYAPLKMRSALVPVCNFTSRYSLPVLLIGLLLEVFLGSGNLFSSILFFTGVAFYGVYTLFTLITLPVEFNASSRARERLLTLGMVSVNDEAKIKEVLNAAAMTYVMSFAMSLLQLLRIVAIFGRRKDD